MRTPIIYHRNLRIDIRTIALAIIAICVTLSAAWQISIQAHQTLSRLLARGWDTDPMYLFELQMDEVVSQIPHAGVTCYVGLSPEGLSPRWAYLWTLYELAPRVVIPWNNRVHETGTRLADVGPTLLFGSHEFLPEICDQILVHNLGGNEDWKICPPYRLEKVLTSGNIHLLLYVR